MAAKRVLAAVGVLLAGCEGDYPVLACRHSIVINEVMAAGSDDWIELFNDSDSEEELEGFVLSSEKWARQWTFPAVTMEPRGFVQVWAVGYYLEDGTLSTGFDLNRDGDALYLRTPSEERSQLCDDVTYPDQHEGVSFARYPDGGEWCYAAQATPGEENTGCF